MQGISPVTENQSITICAQPKNALFGNEEDVFTEFKTLAYWFNYCFLFRNDCLHPKSNKHRFIVYINYNI